MAKQTFGDVTGLFQNFQEAGQVASQVRPQLDYQSPHLGPEHQLAESEQPSFPQLGQSEGLNLGSLDSFATRGQMSQSGTMEANLGPAWVEDYLKTPDSAITATPPVGSSVLTQFFKANQVVKLRYYLDPEVQDIIESGNAITILNLFVAKHPRLLNQSQSQDDFGPGVLKFLKMVLLDSIRPEHLEASKIISSPTISDLRSNGDNVVHRHGFGEVVKINLSALYDKYRTPNCPPSNNLEAKIFRTFEAWQHHNLAKLQELRNSFRSLSSLTWGEPDLANSMPQQVVEFLILIQGPGSFPHWGQGEPSPASAEFQLRQFSQDSQVNPQARTIAQHILSRLPQSFSSGLYRDLMLIAKRLQVEPVENIITFLNENGIDLGQGLDNVTASKETNLPQLLDQLTAAETHQLQLYLKPEVKALIHSAEGRQLAEDFIVGRIVNPQALPPGSLDLIRFLIGEVQLRANPTTKSNLAFGYQNLKGEDIDRNSQLWRDRDFFLLRQVCADMEACGVPVKDYFTAPLKPKLDTAYQRWRCQKTLPGDEYLISYFQSYDGLSYEDIRRVHDRLVNQLNTLDYDLAKFHLDEWGWAGWERSGFYDDPVRQTIADKLAKTTTVFATQVLAKELFKVIPHNTNTPTYKIWAKLVTGLGTTRGNLELNEILNAAKPTTETKVTSMPLAAPVTTGYADVVASREFKRCYQDFSTAPNKSKAKLLTRKLAGMKRLILTRPLAVEVAAALETAGSLAEEYEQLIKALEGIEKIYVGERKAQM